jgi:hypothetical protein
MKITICGSMAFYAEIKAVQKTLIENGHDVLIPELNLEVSEEMGGGKTINFAAYIENNGGIDVFTSENEIWDLKRGAIRDHFEKIDWADAILVVNPEKRGVAGYIGGNTLIEIGVSFYLKKPLYILNSVSSELSYKQEILGMKPQFLDGNLELFLNK